MRPFPGYRRSADLLANGLTAQQRTSSWRPRGDERAAPRPLQGQQAASGEGRPVLDAAGLYRHVRAARDAADIPRRNRLALKVIVRLINLNVWTFAAGLSFIVIWPVAGPVTGWGLLEWLATVAGTTAGAAIVVWRWGEPLGDRLLLWSVQLLVWLDRRGGCRDRL